jgi:hypothetical protein
MEPMRFRQLLLAKLMMLIGVGVLAVVVGGSTLTAGWAPAEWAIAAVAGGGAVAAYGWRAWQRALIVLDHTGVTMFALGGRHTWPFEHLEGVKRVGNWHVQLCFGAPAPDEPHEHVTGELMRPALFADAVLDWYAYTQGHELDNGGTQQLAA